MYHCWVGSLKSILKLGKILALRRNFKFGLLSVAILLTLTACVSTTPRAPVIERSSGSVAPKVKSVKEPDWRPQSYTVQKGDTLYSIALEHGYDYKEIASWNSIPMPYTIRIGQILRLSSTPSEGTSPLKLAPILEAKSLAPGEIILKTEPKALKQIYSEQALAQMNRESVKSATTAILKPEIIKTPAPRTAVEPEPVKAGGADDDDKLDWEWPATGKILANFNDNGSTKGLDIGGTLGQPVAAAAAGKVVHIGSTLRGYGKLIIIKHNKSFFSVYAHNNQVLVREGQSVVKGQRIAEMGSSDADRVKLHFEIRYLGKPTDPLKYLPNDRTP